MLFNFSVGMFFVLSVLQIVKFESSPAKVRMVVDSHHNTPREITFESARVRQIIRFNICASPLFVLTRNSLSDCPPFQKRDSFCQLLQMMKTRHSQLSEPDMVSVFVGTWNMGNCKCVDSHFYRRLVCVLK